MERSPLNGVMQPPVHKVCLVFGPSQFGKSTFINNILKFSPINQLESAQVGTGSGQSITIDVKSYEIGIIPVMFPHCRPGYDTFQIMDVPGILDSGLRISKEEIFKEIKRVLLEKGIKQLDSILVFESMKDDARKLNITMESLLRVFGESAKQSIIVLSTKWDRVDPEEFENVDLYFMQLINNLGLTYIKWQNNIKVRQNFILSEKEEAEQLSLLGAYILRCKPYLVNEMEKLISRRDELAILLREKDPERFVTENTEVEIDVPESYTETMNIPYTEFVPYTDSEINSLAEKLQAIDPGEPQIIEEPKEVTEYKILEKTRYETRDVGVFGWSKENVAVKTQELVETKVEKMVQKTILVPRKLEYFKQFYIGQGKAVNKNKEIPIEKVRFKKELKIIPSEHERHEFDHYIRLATKQLDEELRSNIKSKLV